MLCIVSVASVKNFVTKVIGTENTASVRSALQFTPMVVKVGKTESQIVEIPVGYGNLSFEESEFCEVTVFENVIYVKGLKSTNGSDCAVKGTVYPVPLIARDAVSISSYLLVEVVE